MRYSRLFGKTKKEIPADETSKNAQLLIQAGYIYKEMAGVYAYLPLGLRVIEKIKQIVRTEMNAIGGQELIMTALQRKDLWEKTNRWDDEKVDVWFKSKLKNETEIGFGWSHEEPITEMLNQFVHSYKDLPIFVYQFQTKLRNELRAKSGIMRGREFVMKDMYSYTQNQAEHDKFYAQVTEAYMRIFTQLGLGKETFVTFASGGAFTEYSHEFQTITDAGEDNIYISFEKNIAINEEVLNEKTLEKLNIKKEELTQVKTAEVGNIFDFGTVKSEQLELKYADNTGSITPVHLGSYGIGITRVMGVIAEKFADEKGIVWPENISPYKVHLVGLNLDNEETKVQAEKVYKTLIDNQIETLFDDRVETSVGQKLSDADLIGIPNRLLVSKKTGTSVEFKKRNEEASSTVSVDEILLKLKN